MFLSVSGKRLAWGGALVSLILAVLVLFCALSESQNPHSPELKGRDSSDTKESQTSSLASNRGRSPAKKQETDSNWHPASEFLKSHPYWRPLANFSLNKDIASGLEITDAQVEALEAWLSEFRKESGRIQGDDCTVVRSKRNEELAFLHPVPLKWQGLKRKMEDKLTAILGTEKAAYVLEASKPDLTTLTGNYGAVARLAVIQRNPQYSEYAAGNWPPTWPVPQQYTLQIKAGGEMLGFKESFPEDLQLAIQRESRNAGLVLGFQGGFDQPPDYLAGIFKPQETEESP